MVVVMCGLATAAPSFAQERDPAAQRAALRSLPVVCADYARLCPQPSDGTIGARALLICLKSHTVDVSLRCRHAVATAQTAVPLAP